MTDAQPPLLKNPLFQLNLMIWLSWASSPSVIRNPIFYANGFELFLLGPTIPVPPASTVVATGHNPPINIGRSPKPDLLLCSRADSHFIPLECKVSSFSSTNHKSRQAMGLLACSGQYVAQMFDQDLSHRWKSSLIYIVSHPQHTLMQTSLDSMTATLRGASVPMSQESATSIGIEVRDDGVYLHFAMVNKMPFAVHPIEKVVDSIPGQDPRPLYVVCVDPSLGPDSNDAYGEQVLNEQVRTAFAVQVAAQLHQSRVEVKWEDLMKKAISIWDYWDDRDSKNELTLRVKRHLQKVFTQMKSLGVNVDTAPASFTIYPIDPAKAKSIRTYLAGAAYRRGILDVMKSTQLGIDFPEA